MNEFEELVYEMRSAQINYFRTRSKEVLQQSKKLEKRVDKYLIDKKSDQLKIIITMNELKFNSQVCTTKEQSERLLKLGLKPETADMHHYKWSEGYWGIYTCPPRGSDSCYIPAWSLHRLIELYKDVEDTSMWSLENVNYNRLIQYISLAIKHGAFNKQYLKQ